MYPYLNRVKTEKGSSACHGKPSPILHISPLQQTVKDHISGRLLPLISHHSPCSDWMLCHLESGSGQSVREGGEVCNSAVWCCLVMRPDRREGKKRLLVFLHVS